MSSSPAKVLAIAGMHRSGTSLTARWLAHCGLHLGDELLEASLYNPTGHYEDIRFHQLHVDILKHNGLDYLASDCQRITIDRANKAQAETLIRARGQRAQWGWKDPRTSLVLDFWKSLMDDLKVLAVYRHYSQVAGSLLRRERTALRHHSQATRPVKWLTYPRLTFLNLPLLRKYLKSWVAYNQAIVTYATRHPQDTLVIGTHDLIAQAAQLAKYLMDAWGFELEPVGIESVHVPGLLKNEPLGAGASLASWLVPETVGLWDALGALREQSLARLGVSQSAS